MLGRRALNESNGLHLIQPAQTHGVNLPIDCFFRSLFKDLLNGVASFFKDAEAFEVLKSKVIPELIKNKKPEIPLRIWVAGCAT